MFFNSNKKRFSMIRWRFWTINAHVLVLSGQICWALSMKSPV
jgi:hypothetical protein